MNPLGDIIIAPITPVGHSAIAVLRLSGKGCIELVSQYVTTSERLFKSPSHRLLHTIFTNKNQQPIDEVLISIFRAPHSYTGEDSIELSCHGNPNLVNRILQTLLQRCRLANPGEFTLRAFLNGKLDLSQAEAVNDLICAQASKAESAAFLQLQGKLSQHLQQLLAMLTDARLRCELAIDFADQDLPQIDLDHLEKQLGDILEKATELAASGEQGKKIREGTKICLAGAPNAGKSSLFNALLRVNRAIVTSHPGTTRDYLEESISLSGFPLVIYDTAGLRKAQDEIENQGISQSYALMQQADLILYLVDSSLVDDPEQSALPQDLSGKTITVFSKADLLPPEKRTRQDGAYCSVNEADGLTQLSQAILNRLMLSEDLLHKPLITNARHLAALQKCIVGLSQALQSLRAGQGFEFIAFELGCASSALEEILGVISSDELLEQIFSNFCIGK